MAGLSKKLAIQIYMLNGSHWETVEKTCAMRICASVFDKYILLNFLADVLKTLMIG